MRFLTGVVIGILLTIGTAYVVDSTRATAAEEKEGRMVNWGVVNDNLKGLSSEIHEAWTFFVGKAKDVDKEVEKKANS